MLSIDFSVGVTALLATPGLAQYVRNLHAHVTIHCL